MSRASAGGRKTPVNRVTLGIVGVIVSSLLVYAVFTKRIPFLHDYRLKANFQSSNQLVPGFSPVRIAGVTVGKVASVEDGPGATSTIVMEIEDSALPVHSDARVRIRPRLFLEGGFYVELRSGSPSAPVLEDGDVLPVAQTAGPVQLHQILAAFDQDTLSDLRSIVKELDTAFDEKGAESLGRAITAFGPVLRDTAQIAEAARGIRPHDASEGIASTAKITKALASREAELRGLVTALNTTTTALASRDTQVAASVREVDRLIRVAPSALDSVDAVQPAFRRTIAALRPALRAAPPVLDDTAATLRQLRALTEPAELPALLDALEPTVRRLPKLERRLGRLFPLVTPVMDCLREHAVPVLNTQVPDQELSSGRPVWQELGQAGVAVVGFASNFDGNGYTSRYLNGAGEQAFATGAVPGLGQLVGTTSQPISGSRPTYLGPGQVPPHRPDAQCADQAAVDLTQRTAGGAPAATRAAAPVARASAATGLGQWFARAERALSKMGTP